MFRLLMLTTILNLAFLSTAQPVQQDNTSPDPSLHTSMRREEPRLSWTSAPNERGTSDILWSCISTTFLCCWSTLCLNVPAPQDTKWVQFGRKFWVFALTICGPEFISISAVGQWVSARGSIKDFAAAGINNWSLHDAFFADMGGFTLQTRDWVPSPISAKQLLWLIQHGYVSLSPSVLGRIKDKNKVDGMGRFIMALQTLWFLANFFSRLAQGLAITAIELSTVAFIYCSLPLLFIWRHKPADVEISEVLITDATMAEILLAGGDAAREPYINTPLDFIDRKEWAWTIYWSHLRNLIRVLPIMTGPHVRPVDRVPNFDCPEIPTWLFCAGALYAFGFAAIFVCGWNLAFPTHTEQLLWRAASLVCLLALLASEIVTELTFKVWPYLKSTWLKSKSNVDQPESNRCDVLDGSRKCSTQTYAVSQRRTIWKWMRNNSTGPNPHVHVPLRALLPIYILASSYFLARGYIIIEDILELRSLPQSCFQTPNWSQFVPHFG